MKKSLKLLGEKIVVNYIIKEILTDHKQEFSDGEEYQTIYDEFEPFPRKILPKKAPKEKLAELTTIPVPQYIQTDVTEFQLLKDRKQEEKSCFVFPSTDAVKQVTDIPGFL